MKKVVLGLSLVASMAIFANANEPIGTNSGWDLFKTNKSTYSVQSPSKLSIGDTVAQIAEELAKSLKKEEITNKSIAITSFVELHQLNKTTNFGRILSESFFNELHNKGMNVMDFRMQKDLAVNANGEFFLSRDVKKLNESVESDYILIGTYTKIQEGVLINSRILNTVSGKVVASSRVVYGDTSCEIFEDCKTVVKPEPKPVNKIKIVTDGCATEKCPINCVTEKCPTICDKSCN